MAIARVELLEKLRDSYEYYYDLREVGNDAGELPLAIRAEFHSRDEGYVLVKAAKIWAMESNEYLYLFSAPSIDEKTAASCLDYAVKEGLSRVKPHSEHKETSSTAVFIADTIDPAVLELIRRRKEYKSFRLGLHGWAILRTCAVCLEKEMVVTNDAGKCLQK